MLQHEIVPGGDVALAVVRPASNTESEPIPDDSRRAVRQVAHGSSRSGSDSVRAEVARHLARNGASRQFIERVCARVRDRLAVGVHALDVAGLSPAARAAVAEKTAGFRPGFVTGNSPQV